MKQGSIEWQVEKLGKFSASKIFELMGKTKITQGGITYIIEKVTEELTQLWNEINAPAIEWGNRLEPFAAEHYAKVFKVKLIKDAWKRINDHAGVSPDRLIEGEEKGIEIKCPFNRSNHTKNLLLKSQEEFKKLRPEYYWQIQMQMKAYNFDRWDFVSYHPEFEGINKMFVLEVKRDQQDQQLLEKRLQEAIILKQTYLHNINN